MIIRQIGYFAAIMLFAFIGFNVLEVPKGLNVFQVLLGTGAFMLTGVIMKSGQKEFTDWYLSRK